MFSRLLGTAKVPLGELTRGGPQSKDVDTILFDGNGQPLPQVIHVLVTWWESDFSLPRPPVFVRLHKYEQCGFVGVRF